MGWTPSSISSTTTTRWTQIELRKLLFFELQGISIFSNVWRLTIHGQFQDSFHLVDTRPPPRPKYGARRFQQVFDHFQHSLCKYNRESRLYSFVVDLVKAIPDYHCRRECSKQRFQRRDRDEGRRDGGRDSGAGADRERQRRERLQQQKRGQWNAYWQDKNAPRVVYNSSVSIFCGHVDSMFALHQINILHLLVLLRV